MINSRQFKGGSRWQRFVELEKPVLKPSPTAPISLGRWLLPKVVPNNGYVCIDKNWYSLPEKYIGKSVIPKLYAEAVELYFDGRNQHFCVATHTRCYLVGEYVTDPSHTKKTKREREANSYQHYLTWAEQTESSFLVVLIKAQLQVKKTDLATREACKGYYDIYVKCKADGENTLRIYFNACQEMCEFNKVSVSDFKRTLRLLKKSTQPDEKIITRDIDSIT